VGIDTDIIVGEKLLSTSGYGHEEKLSVGVPGKEGKKKKD